MKLKKPLLLAGLAILAFPYAALAETWYTIQGSGGNWKGTWVKKDGEKPDTEHFSMTLQNGSAVVTGNVTVNYSANNNVSAQSYGSDGATCMYSGVQNDYNITGTQVCSTGGGVMNWYVTISPGVGGKK